MEFKSVAEAKDVIKQAKAYLSASCITEKDIYPGAVFISASNNVTACVLGNKYNPDKFFIGGFGGDPTNAWSDFALPKTRDDLVAWFIDRRWKKAKNIRIRFIEEN